ncbi:MAG: EamA family transporter [Oscillospiraceae bacterium]|nr:EamA family transporter [Oscillospiraceae bacterium]
MWVTLIIASVLLAGSVAVFDKAGLKHVDCTVAAALRTTVFCACLWLYIFSQGAHRSIRAIGSRTWVFLLLYGLSTGLSVLCYYRALKPGDVNQVEPVRSTANALTMLVGIFQTFSYATPIRVIYIVLILVGTILMLARDYGSSRCKGDWLPFAILSAVFAVVSTYLQRYGGFTGFNSYLTNAIRFIVVLILTWMVVLLGNKTKALSKVTLHDTVFLVLSGLAGVGALICLQRSALLGPGYIIIVLSKLSIVAAVLLACIFLREKLSGRALGGLLLIVAGTLLLLF